ncbi:hypothetical protein LCGC14_1891490, partial [marine sediment metagenome]
FEYGWNGKVAEKNSKISLCIDREDTL